ncbi:FaeA/PapI family transcriptional regulator [Citrobacter portucalensis]|uniref:FaeA/PapI family transcriptional regulator n=1 Tax=Citrobacter portucalensis TaxID=1639133 RepID=UPI003C2FFFDB
MRSILAEVIKSGGKGVTTRDISNCCDMSIYSARNWLIRLEDEGQVFHTNVGKNKVWFLKN